MLFSFGQTCLQESFININFALIHTLCCSVKQQQEIIPHITLLTSGALRTSLVTSWIMLPYCLLYTKMLVFIVKFYVRISLDNITIRYIRWKEVLSFFPSSSFLKKKCHTFSLKLPSQFIIFHGKDLLIEMSEFNNQKKIFNIKNILKI